jgi:5-methylcytosine-specific restriction endonuclease McrA
METMDLLNKTIVLRLNRAWQAIGESTVKDALIAMNSGDEFVKAAVAIDVQYERDANGEWDFSQYANLVPTLFEDWIKLPVRDFDAVIHTAKLTIRVPTVIVAQNYAKMPQLEKHVSNKAIRERDESRCQVTGRVLSRTEGNVDHLLPRSRGGKDTFENMVWMDKKINSVKNNKTLEEAGLTLIRKPFKPKPLPASATIRELKHRDWKFFLKHEGI